MGNWRFIRSVAVPVYFSLHLLLCSQCSSECLSTAFGVTSISHAVIDWKHGRDHRRATM